MNLEKLKHLADLKEEHLDLYKELQGIRAAGEREFMKSIRGEFESYFNKNGFAASSESDVAITMKYKSLSASLHVFGDTFELKLPDGVSPQGRIHQECDSYKPTHVNDSLPLDAKIDHEVKSIGELRLAIANTPPCCYYLTIGKQAKRHDCLSDVLRSFAG